MPIEEEIVLLPLFHKPWRQEPEAAPMPNVGLGLNTSTDPTHHQCRSFKSSWASVL